MTLLVRQLCQGSMDFPQPLLGLCHDNSHPPAVPVAQLEAFLSFPLVNKTRLGTCNQARAALHQFSKLSLGFAKLLLAVPS